MPCHLGSRCENIQTTQELPGQTILILRNQSHHQYGQWCGAINCTNSKKKSPECSFHRFPADEKRCKKWLESINRADLFYRSTAYLHKNVKICSRHFEKTCYVRTSNFLRKDAGCMNHCILRKDAVPTIFDAVPPEKKSATKKGTARKKKTSTKKKTTRKKRTTTKKKATTEKKTTTKKKVSKTSLREPCNVKSIPKNKRKAWRPAVDYGGSTSATSLKIESVVTEKEETPMATEETQSKDSHAETSAQRSSTESQYPSKLSIKLEQLKVEPLEPPEAGSLEPPEAGSLESLGDDSLEPPEDDSLDSLEDAPEELPQWPETPGMSQEGPLCSLGNDESSTQQSEPGDDTATHGDVARQSPPPEASDAAATAGDRPEPERGNADARPHPERGGAGIRPYPERGSAGIRPHPDRGSADARPQARRCNVNAPYTPTIPRRWIKPVTSSSGTSSDQQQGNSFSVRSVNRGATLLLVKPRQRSDTAGPTQGGPRGTSGDQPWRTPYSTTLEIPPAGGPSGTSAAPGAAAKLGTRQTTLRTALMPGTSGQHQHSQQDGSVEKQPSQVTATQEENCILTPLQRFALKESTNKFLREQELRCEKERLEKRFESQKRVINMLRCKVNRQTKKMAELERRLNNPEISSEHVLKFMERTLPRTINDFFKLQLESVDRNPLGRRYSDEELSNSLAIYRQSRKAYDLLRARFFLPSPRVLRRLLEAQRTTDTGTIILPF